MRTMDQNRKSGVVTGMPGVSYWQDGCFYDQDYKFVKAENPELDEQSETLKQAMSDAPSFAFKEPGSMAYSEAYGAAIKLSAPALKAAAAKLSQDIGTYDGEKIVVYSGTGSKQKNAKTVAMYG